MTKIYNFQKTFSFLNSIFVILKIKNNKFQTIFILILADKKVF